MTDTECLEIRDNRRRAFDRAFSEWLAARAAIEARGERTDAEIDRVQTRLDRAEVALVATPALYPDAIWLKFELVEQLVTHERVDGESAYPLRVLALASLKADILSIGLKGD